jgi:hypothetical protein
MLKQGPWLSSWRVKHDVVGQMQSKRSREMVTLRPKRSGLLRLNYVKYQVRWIVITYSPLVTQLNSEARQTTPLLIGYTRILRQYFLWPGWNIIYLMKMAHPPLPRIGDEVGTQPDRYHSSYIDIGKAITDVRS